jgi:hypothetical protein
MFDENKVLRQENQSMRNLIDCLADKESLQHTFWQMDWSFFFTVAYKAERNKTSCFKQMHGLYDYLSKKYQDSTELRLFFTTEPFTNRSGHHNHFDIHIGNKKLHKQIVTEIQQYFNYDRTDVSIYDRYKARLFYIAKKSSMERTGTLSATLPKPKKMRVRLKFSQLKRVLMTEPLKLPSLLREKILPIENFQSFHD